MTRFKKTKTKARNCNRFFSSFFLNWNGLKTRIFMKLFYTFFCSRNNQMWRTKLRWIFNKFVPSRPHQFQTCSPVIGTGTYSMKRNRVAWLKCTILTNCMARRGGRYVFDKMFAVASLSLESLWSRALGVPTFPKSPKTVTAWALCR